MEIFIYICGGILLLLVIAIVTRLLTGIPKVRKYNETNFDHDIFHNGGKRW